MLTLYAAKNTVALATQIALEETGLPHKVVWIDFAGNEQRSDAFLAVNPKGRVPALLTEEGILTETPALLEYVAETAGQLMPASGFDRAKTREMLSYCAATFHVNHAHKLRGHRWSDDVNAHASMTAKVPQTMAESCAYIETLLTDGWVVGDYSIADIHLFTVCTWLESDGVDIAGFPKLAKHFAAMMDRPAVARALAHHG